jgi:hypothetical protein
LDWAAVSSIPAVELLRRDWGIFPVDGDNGVAEPGTPLFCCAELAIAALAATATPN